MRWRETERLSVEWVLPAVPPRTKATSRPHILYNKINISWQDQYHGGSQSPSSSIHAHSAASVCLPLPFARISWLRRTLPQPWAFGSVRPHPSHSPHSILGQKFPSSLIQRLQFLLGSWHLPASHPCEFVTRPPSQLPAFVRSKSDS